ncbi:unnamed protein product [Paramecium primaurelia]|uniref:Uncharacterized protein n=1 Tax=Paramecium primaurelia TaxID=5886 RepID=A0A8S1K001_PARPR|nr:unnamed protein product [Paramecium primaurelia]
MTQNGIQKKKIFEQPEQQKQSEMNIASTKARIIIIPSKNEKIKQIQNNVLFYLTQQFKSQIITLSFHLPKFFVILKRLFNFQVFSNLLAQLKL